VAVFLFLLLLFFLLLLKNSLWSLSAMKNAFDAFQILLQWISEQPLFLQMAARGLTQKNGCKRSLVIYAKTRNSVLIDFKDLGYFGLKKHSPFFLEKGVL
jgi:hypothetical protein